MHKFYSIRAVLILTAPLLLAAIAPRLSTALAQGSLTPAGAPAPTFKTLSQVEPRYPISTFQTNLTVSGSYYLTTNLYNGANANDGINIRTNVNNITIDLNGFTIFSTNPAGADSPVGIRISAATNIVICNGQISGFDRSIRSEFSRGVVVENIHSYGCRRAGIEATGSAGDPAASTIVVRNCVVEGVDATGEPAASVSCDGIVIFNCTGVVENCVVRDLTAVGTGTASCINATSPTNTFINNNYLSNAEFGLKMSGGGTRVYYRDNLTAGVGTSFSGTGGVDRGGNF